MHPSDSFCPFCTVYCAIGHRRDDISGQKPSSDVVADVRVQNYHGRSGTTIPVSASVLKSTCWSTVDELTLQHFARPETQCKSYGSTTADRWYATQCTSKTPEAPLYCPVYTSSIHIDLMIATDCLKGTSCHHRYLRRKHAP